jgi:alpha-1,3-rhamnosyltransferase
MNQTQRVRKDNLPLVSIVVITYNSAKYIMETLESIKEQTYQAIELIISDDCSTDNTVELCSQWVEENKKWFVNTKIVVSEKNAGVAPNLNRGITASIGEWIKLVAGDDLLFSNSIMDFIDFVIKNNCTICCCKLEVFGNTTDREAINKKEKLFSEEYRILKRDLAYQKKMNLRGIIAPGPGWFFSRALFGLISGFDESYPFFEEWPFISRVLNSGNRIFFVDRYLCRYRIHSAGLSYGEFGVKKIVFEDVKKYIYQEKLIGLLQHGDILYAWHMYLSYSYLTIMYNSNRDSFVFKYVKYILLFFSPLAYVHLIKRIIRKYALR